MYEYKYPHPAVTTDCVVFGFDGTALTVLLIERGNEPCKGMLAFPGGFLNMEENAEDGAFRELREETGLIPAHMEQFHTFSDVGRDPRERVITIAYYALVKMTQVHGGDDAADARWYRIKDIRLLAFDHLKILDTALRCLREHTLYRFAGLSLLPERFTMAELRNLYEAIFEMRFDSRSFSRKMLSSGLLLEAQPNDGRADGRLKYYRIDKESYRRKISGLFLPHGMTPYGIKRVDNNGCF